MTFPGTSSVPTSPNPPAGPALFPGPRQVSVGKLPSVSRVLIGRQDELEKLDTAWTDPTVGMVSIVAFGGVGKTSLAINWWHRSGAPGAVRILGWTFHSQGTTDNRQASADPFLDYALRTWFGVSDPPKDSWERGECLADLIRRERTLLILDGVEPLQFPPGDLYGHFKDPGMVALLKELAASNPGLCICTSRLPLTDLEDYDNLGLLTIDLDNLTAESGGQYLATLEVQGDEVELREASMDFDNHALALTLLGNYLVKRRGGDVRKRDTIPSIFADPTKGGHARRILRQYEALFKGKTELSVLRILGLFDRPADPDALAILRQTFEPLRDVSPDDWCTALESLSDARLIEYSDPNGPIDCHALIREHFTEDFRTSDRASFQQLHSRLYECYLKQVPYSHDTLESMAPLFYAVYHGCQAGRHGEAYMDVYRHRILRGKEFFLTQKLGAFSTDLSLLANFFNFRWIEAVSGLSPSDQGVVMSRTGFALRASGRLLEALQLMRASSDAARKTGDWKEAVLRFNNLAELYLVLGHIPEAIEASRLSVKFADRIDDFVLRELVRIRLAYSLHQYGDLALAARLFQIAESMQAMRRPDTPILYGVRGYFYCDLLLAQGRSEDVVCRGRQTLEIAVRSSLPLLDIALEHLSLGRAHRSTSIKAAYHLRAAVYGLRKAGQVDYLPLGLLARACHFRDTCDWAQAQKDLDEVRILANRCGMRLHLIDYHLEQSRLLLAQGQRVSARPHYDSARQLIEDTGYHRRKAEVTELAREFS